MLDSRVAEYGEEMLYLNKSARIPVLAMEHSSDDALCKYPAIAFLTPTAPTWRSSRSKS